MKNLAFNAIVMADGFVSIADLKEYLADKDSKPEMTLFVAVGKNCDTGLLISKPK